jgi:ammonia channel protein AmtB
LQFAALGGFILMFAFFAFNGGSRLTLKDEFAGQVRWEIEEGRSVGKT